MIGHYIDKCRGCDKVMGQCRCPDNNKEIRWGICDECLAIVKRERDSVVKENIAKFRKDMVDTKSGSYYVWYNLEAEPNGPWFATDAWTMTEKHISDGTLFGLLKAIQADIVPDHILINLYNLRHDPYL